MELPTTLLFMDFKPKSKTTVIMSFDNGWQFSFRIHNAKDMVEPSLKFDVQIVGMPPPALKYVPIPSFSRKRIITAELSSPLLYIPMTPV